MPKLSQGNIFDAVEATQLVVIFGHKGFNLMDQTWSEFSSGIPALKDISDPFKRFSNKPVMVRDRRWLWFIAEESDHGMSDERLFKLLDDVFEWAIANGIKSVATNGIKNDDVNSNGYTKRVRDLTEYIKRKERESGIFVKLISLNDIYLR